VRELVTILGVAVILVGVVFANTELRRGNLRDRYISYRKSIETERRQGGLELVKWDLLQETRGTLKTGPTFSDALLKHRDEHVNLVGFMIPLDEYREAKEFLLLPMPIECYFCEAPPLREVVLVQMAEGTTTDIFDEPVLINGSLTLNEGPGTKFFYVFREASLGPGKEDDQLHRKEIDIQHRAHQAAEDMNKEPLLEGKDEPAEAVTD
jgi:hypothetical protein